MGIRSAFHVLSRQSFVAANVTDPASVSSDHLSFTDDSSNIYVEDKAEFDGEVFHDASFSEIQVTVTGATTLDATHRVVYADTDSIAITITLPALVGVQGRMYEIKNIGTSGNIVTIDGNGAETVEGDLTFALSDGEALTVRADTADWRAT